MAATGEVHRQAAGTTSDAPGAPAAASAPAARVRRWPGVLLILVGTTLAYTAVMLAGRAAEAANTRVLALFDPLFLWIRGAGSQGTDWLDRHPLAVAGMLSAGLAVLLAAGVAAARRQAAAVIVVVAMLALGIWGQALLLADHVSSGTALYLAGLAAALAFGFWRPMRRLPGFPSIAGLGAGTGGAWQPAWAVECALVFALAVLALVFRAWALTENSEFLDLEVVDSWAQSRTLFGAAEYYRNTFLTTNPGAAHILPQWALFNVFGSSLFTLRMAAVGWGVAAVLLMYWLVRRLAGVGPALLAGLFFATAPDQLFWSRSENGFFSPVPVLALLTVHAGLSMAERFTLPNVTAAALLMPASRYFYTTCLAMVAFPLAVAAHAALFVRGAWRRLWFVLPLLALGLVAWWFHLTVLLGVLTGDYRFRHPAQIYGGTAWTKQGDFAQASLPELVRLQAESMGTHMQRVLRDLTYEQHNSFGHWYMRSQPNPHPTTMNVGLVVLLVLGIGYLGGQLRDPRAFMLLVWLVIALLPGIGSRDATPRRMSMLFPAAHVIGVVLLAAVVRTLRQAAGRRTATLALAVMAPALALVVLTNTVSHFRLPMRPMIFADYLRFLRPVLAESDTVLLNLPGPFRHLVLFDEIDRFVESPWCFEGVEDPDRWLPLALRPRCSFADPAYRLALTPEEREAARAAHRMQRISFVFFVDPLTRPQLALVRGLYPDAEFAEYVSPRDQRHIAVVTFTTADAAARRTPVLRSRATPPPTVLAGVPVHVTRDGAPADGGAVLEGGLLLDHDDWYTLTLEPRCDQALLELDGQPVAPGGRLPLLAGVHPLALRLPPEADCALPLRLRAARGAAGAELLGADHFTSPAVARQPAAAAARVQPYPGYAPPAVLTQLPGRAGDLAVGPDGTLHVLIKQDNRWRLFRYTPEGTQLEVRELNAPRELDPGTMSVAPDGSVAMLFGRTMIVHGPDGREQARWENIAFVWETQIGFWGSDRLLATIPHRNALAVFSRTGEPLGEYTHFPGGPAEFFSPTSFATSPDGDLVLLQLDGRALWFVSDPAAFAPVFARTFPVGSPDRGLTLDGRTRLLLVADGSVHAHDADGTRLVAEGRRDPGRLRLGKAARVRAAGDRVYVLDPEGSRVWILRR